MTDLNRARKAGVAGLVLAKATATWLIRRRERAREDAEQRERTRRVAQEEWEAAAPERLRRQEESKERERQREKQFLAAAEAKGWRYEEVGQCHLPKGKKRYPTELDAQIATRKQLKKHGGSLQRAYRCNGLDTSDGVGCGSWHLTSTSSFT